MVKIQKTSWEGIHTKRLRREKRVRGMYTRYANRSTRQGLQVVKNRKNYSLIFSPKGTLLGIEPKYASFSTDDRVAKRIFENKIKPKIPVKLRKKILR